MVIVLIYLIVGIIAAWTRVATHLCLIVILQTDVVARLSSLVDHQSRSTGVSVL
jgi:hypothetical protein